MKIQQKFLSSTKGKSGGEHKKWATLRESWEFGYLHYTEDRLRYALQSLHLAITPSVRELNRLWRCLVAFTIYNTLANTESLMSYLVWRIFVNKTGTLHIFYFFFSPLSWLYALFTCEIFFCQPPSLKRRSEATTTIRVVQLWQRQTKPEYMYFCSRQPIAYQRYKTQHFWYNANLNKNISGHTHQSTGDCAWTASKYPVSRLKNRK